MIRITFLLLLTAYVVTAQPAAPFASEIKAFQKEDSLHPPLKNGILFIGSSSFTYWHKLPSYFPGYPIINRAFGGSTLADQIFYFRNVVAPYRAKQIVIYCGENDLAYNPSFPADSALTRFKKLFSLIRNNDATMWVTFVSMKPSPSRHHFLKSYTQANNLIRDFLKKQKRTDFVDVASIMLNKNGKPKASLFTADSLHMNTRGYALWQKIILPYLKH
ncbi:MAG: G-D-S-L family lipolytic protein [Bacteroidetes bacterium]|nr:G-D-S-L family lipolytic protein [Bacteroidota bacterium]MBS1540341.1 G-D-S-L family lipolytic protein [Bacteroidota bacterium]